MRLLVPGATDSYAYGINASGMVTVAADNRGYVWQHGVFTRIRAGGGVPVQPGGINDAGVVVGQVYQGTQDAFVWQNGVLTKLPRLPGANDDNQAAAVAINDSGVIVGYCMLAAHYHPCRWVDGQVEDLGLFPGGDQGFALAVNDAGEVVGRSFAPGEHSYRAHAFIYRDGEMLDLQKLVVDLPRHVFLANAVAINNRGEIVVQAYEDEPLIDSHHYFLLTPTDAD
jgi:probable HAF family extracellular repeat protein